MMSTYVKEWKVRFYFLSVSIKILVRNLVNVISIYRFLYQLLYEALSFENQTLDLRNLPDDVKAKGMRESSTDQLEEQFEVLNDIYSTIAEDNSEALCKENKGQYRKYMKFCKIVLQRCLWYFKQKPNYFYIPIIFSLHKNILRIIFNTSLNIKNKSRPQYNRVRYFS